MSGRARAGALLLGLGLVTLPVQRQVVRSAERAVTGLADERLGARVLADVARELVRAGEAPVTALPRAQVRLLTCEHTKRNNMRHKLSHAQADL